MKRGSRADNFFLCGLVIAFASFVSFVFLVAACNRAPHANPNTALRTGALKGSNVLLVTIDTLRADRVGAYSGGRLTPSIDALAARGVRFTDAHAHVPLTLPAHTSILTGLVPPHHRIHNNGAAALADGTPTLASILHAAGYRTGAVVGAFVLDARFGLARGFDTYDDRVGADTGPVTFAFAERTADRVVKAAGDWILGANQQSISTQQSTSTQQSISNLQPAISNEKWFAWVHLFDPHAPYRAPEQRVADPYDNEVAFADAQLGALFDRLRAARQLDSTLVIVLSDHGESLGEHGEATHGLFAYEATLRIPLIIAGPRMAAAVSDAAVAQIDVLPTILDLLGISTAGDRSAERLALQLDGRSLVPAIRGDAWPERPIYFEALDAYLTRNWAPLTGVIAGGWKYIDLPDAELYDLAADPGERRNRLRDARDRAAALQRQLADWPPPWAMPAARAAPIDPDAAARLRALGYTASESARPERAQYTSRDDPKSLLDVDRRYERALTLTGERRFAEAASLLESVVADRRDFTVAYLNLASVFLAAGEPRRAISMLEDAAGRGVTSPELQARLGAAYLAAGDLKRAAAVLEPVADPARPGGLDAANTLGIVLTQSGQHTRARQLFQEVLARSPRSSTTWSNLGLLELAAHRPADAARAFEQAVAADPRFAQAWQGLGAARASSDPIGAVEAWKHALQLEPHNYDVLFNIAVTLREQGRAADARPYIERFVREAPPERYARDLAMFRKWLSESR